MELAEIMKSYEYDTDRYKQITNSVYEILQRFGLTQNEAKVLGVDPNENYIKLAKQNAIQGATFEQMNIGFTNSLEKLQSASFDYVFMSDALLFYFVPPKLEQKPDIQNLLVNIRRLLKPDGIFINVEPHYIFWLLPWCLAVS